MDKYKKIFIIIIVLLSLFIIGCNNEQIDTYSIHTEVQSNYLKDNYENIGLYAKGSEDLSKPLPFVLNFDEDLSIKISEDKELKEYKEYATTNKSISLYNLKIGTIYYYQTNLSEGIKTFKIADDAPRNLSVDGLTNVRDIGGWKVGNKLTNQGLLYRSSKFNEDESTELVISENGINTLVNEFKIKTELDLRTVDDNENGGITSSPLGESVNYISLPMKSGGNCILLNKDKFVELFDILSDSNNYPMIIHCSIGTDRTGMVAFVINALLGVSDDDLYRDYLFSNFGLIYRMRTKNTIDSYFTVLQSSNGNSTKERMFNYLVSLGVDSNKINTFIKIMSE